MSKKPVAAGKSSFDLIDVDKTFTELGLAETGSFLDLACGAGRYSLEIARRFRNSISVYAIDLWQEGIKILEQQAAEQGLENIQAQVADLREDLPLDSTRFEVCLMATVLHDLERNQRGPVVQEVARVLKPGGSFGIIEFKKLDKGPGPPIHIRMDEDEVSALVEPLGFEKISSLDIGDYNYLVQYRKRPG